MQFGKELSTRISKDKYTEVANSMTKDQIFETMDAGEEAHFR